MKKALIVRGGLELHEPEAGAEVLRGMLTAEGFDVSVTWVDNSGATAASTSNLYDDRIVLSVGKSF